MKDMHASTLERKNYCMVIIFKLYSRYDYLIPHYSTIPIPREWLVRSTPDRAVRALVLAGDTVLCSWAITHFTPRVPLFTQGYKWVPAKCWG